ncbi:MAG: zf-HC2 domain-containing protein [Nitrospirae bacterium]|nr:zf-HC2 domain-containing protein [Nitrospirota bacterium]
MTPAHGSAGIDEKWAIDLMAYRDGELDSSRRNEVGRHILECVPCQSLLRDFGKVGNRLRENADEDASRLAARPVWPGVRRALAPPAGERKAEARTRRTPFQAFRWAFALPAILLVFLGAILYDSIRPAPAPEGAVIVGLVESPDPVFLFQQRGSSVTVIWVFEPQPAPPIKEEARST